MKAIAIHAVFLMGVIAISLFFIVAIFWGWIDVTKYSTSEATCRANKVSFCSALVSGTSAPNWNDGCSAYGINKPTSSQECCAEGYKGPKC